jgi:tetratricopeptide (TPR) repeat protein
MTTRVIVSAIACCLLAGAAHDRSTPSSSDQREPPQRLTLDAVFAAYLGGDLDVVPRSFGRSRDFPDRLRLYDSREFEHWLGPWDRRKALLLIEIARATAEVSPRFPRVVVDAGRRYVLTAGRGELDTPEAAALVHLWHRAAAALLQRFGTSFHVDEYVRDVAGRTGAPLDARLVLARGVAQERTCWDNRPSLDQPDFQTGVLTRAAGVRIRAELSGPPPALRAANVMAHKACLGAALARFEAAAAIDDVRDEARVRGGWILFQLERFQEAIEWLDAAAPRDDRDLEYWRLLFRGRVFESLDRPQDALSAYQAAQVLCPGAQSAGIGHALVLLHLDRAAEADASARALRASTTADPWLIYPTGDYRFVDRWIDQLRTAWR